MSKRTMWRSYFMDVVEIVASRSTCLRRHAGAILVDSEEKRIITTGYNGPPRGLRHCDLTGCIRELREIEPGRQQELCRGLHAEQNAIIQAAMYGVSIRKTMLYTSFLPCSFCAKMLINAGISRIAFKDYYPEPPTTVPALADPIEMFKETGVDIFRVVGDEVELIR